LGFLGLGWIGLQRMAAIVAAGDGKIVALADPLEDLVAEAGELVKHNAGTFIFRYFKAAGSSSIRSGNAGFWIRRLNVHRRVRLKCPVWGGPNGRGNVAQVLA